MNHFSQSDLKDKVEDAITLIRGFLDEVRPPEMSGKAFGYGPFPTRIMDFGGLSIDKSLEQARRAALKGKWDCCVLAFEAWTGEPPKPGAADTRDEIIIFIGEARRLKPVAHQFEIDRMPDGTIRLGKRIERGEVANVLSRFGPMFSQPELN